MRLLRFLRTHFLQNAVQENIKIIYFDWCRITKIKSLPGHIFSYCKHLWVFFEDFELNKTLFWINWKRCILILNVIVWIFWTSASTVRQFYSGFSLVQVLAQDLLLQSLLKVTTPLEYVRKFYVHYIYIKKKRLKSFQLVYSLHNISYNLVL